jgi:uncharacterized PurR-regulated membrane protein YhhQ (DUF165 family)
MSFVWRTLNTPRSLTDYNWDKKQMHPPYSLHCNSIMIGLLTFLVKLRALIVYNTIKHRTKTLLWWKTKTSARLVSIEVSNIISMFINNSQSADGLRLSKPSLVYFWRLWSHGYLPPITTSGFQDSSLIMQILLLSKGAVWLRTVT